MKTRKWQLTRNVQLLWEPADFWVGLFWDRVKRKLYFLPVPCFGLVIQFEQPRVVEYMDSVPTEVVAKFPHCDPRVLHKPGACVFCDRYPNAQTDRIECGINFTGEQIPGLRPCPADAARGLGKAHEWYGNRPTSE